MKMTKTKREKMFVLIATAIKKLQKQAGISEDQASQTVIGFLRTFPAESVMDLDVLSMLLDAIVDLESEDVK
jgi:hypothetical protein